MDGKTIALPQESNDDVPKESAVKKLLLPASQRYLIHPSSVAGNSADDDVNVELTDESEGSVLRALLQANRRQMVVYQSTKPNRIPFRGGNTTYVKSAAFRQNKLQKTQIANSSIESELTMVKSSLNESEVEIEIDMEVFKNEDNVDDDDDDDGESRVAVTHIQSANDDSGVTIEDEGLQTNSDILSQRIDSQIKALLLGHNYVREQSRVGHPAGRNSTTTTFNQSRSTSICDEQSSNTKKIKTDKSVIGYSERQEEIINPLFSEAIKVIAEFSDLNYSVQYGHRSSFLEVRRKGLYGIPSLGQTPVQVIISEDGLCQFVSLTGTIVNQVDCKINSAIEYSLADELRPLLYKLSIKSGHVYCPGIETELTDSVLSSILLGVCQVDGPPISKRHRSKKCQVWHSLASDQNNRSNWLALNSGVHKCPECRQIDIYLRTVKNKKSSSMGTTPTQDNVTKCMSVTADRPSTAAIDVQPVQQFIYVWEASAEEMES